MENIRLQKYFTDCGVLSRRAAEEEIKAGRVKVNGLVAQLGDKIDPENDVVEYKGKRIEPTKGSDFVYILLNIDICDLKTLGVTHEVRNKFVGYLAFIPRDSGKCVTCPVR